MGCGVWGVGCGVWGVGCGVLGAGCRVKGLGFEVRELCSGVWELGLGVPKRSHRDVLSISTLTFFFQFRHHNDMIAQASQR